MREVEFAKNDVVTIEKVSDRNSILTSMRMIVRGPVPCMARVADSRIEYLDIWICMPQPIDYASHVSVNFSDKIPTLLIDWQY